MYSSCWKSLSIKLTAVNRIWMKIFLLVFCWLSTPIKYVVAYSHRNEVVCLLISLLRVGESIGCFAGYSAQYHILIFNLDM